MTFMNYVPFEKMNVYGSTISKQNVPFAGLGILHKVFDVLGGREMLSKMWLVRISKGK